MANKGRQANLLAPIARDACKHAVFLAVFCAPRFACCKKTPIVACTASAMAADAQACYDAEINDVAAQTGEPGRVKTRARRLGAGW